MFGRTHLAALAFLGVILPASSGFAEVLRGTYGLGPASISATVASFELTLDFDSDAGEEVVFFGLDVSPSDPLLTAAGTDYSAFSFTKASPLLDDWDLVPFTGFGPGPLSYGPEYDTVLAPLLPGVYTLGTLSVDFGAAAPGTTLSVSVEGLGSLIGHEIPGDPQSFDLYPADFDPGSRDFVVPGEPVVIPEPSVGVSLIGLLGLSVAAFLRRRRPQAG